MQYHIVSMTERELTAAPQRERGECADSSMARPSRDRRADSRANFDERHFIMETHTPTTSTRNDTGRSTSELWSYRDQNAATRVKEGFKVEALDGSIGKIDECSREAGRGYIVVDTGGWIMGKKVMLPAGVVDRVDPNDEKVFVSRTKDQIKNAPEYDETRKNDEKHRSDFSGYYGQGGRGFRTQ
ncbi:MAG: hypothetical protein ABR599_09925 [Gemmatimonadota bacterium]